MRSERVSAISSKETVRLIAKFAIQTRATIKTNWQHNLSLQIIIATRAHACARAIVSMHTALTLIVITLSLARNR